MFAAAANREPEAVGCAVGGMDFLYTLEDNLSARSFAVPYAECLDLLAGGLCTSSSSSLTNGSSREGFDLTFGADSSFLSDSRMRLSRARRAASSCARSDRNVLSVVTASVDMPAEAAMFIDFTDLEEGVSVCGVTCVGGRGSSSSDETRIGLSLLEG